MSVLSLLSNEASVNVSTGDSLDLREVTVSERVSTLFSIDVVAMSRNQDIDFTEVIGNAARLEVRMRGGVRGWDGVVEEMALVRTEAAGLATYRLRIVPRLWLMTQRKNYRVFQYQSELEIVEQLLGEWSIPFTKRTRDSYKQRKFVVQYGETDFAFLSRMLETIGVAYGFEPSDGTTMMVLDDSMHAADVATMPLPFFDEPPDTASRWAKDLAISQRVRPGKHRIGDLDYRKPATAQPASAAARGLPQEQQLEIFDWVPGAMLFKSDGGGDTPSADDRGASRTDMDAGSTLAEVRLLAERANARSVRFSTNVLELVPGATMNIEGHAHREIDGKSLLIVGSVITGGPQLEWRATIECASTEQPFKPPQVTPKPRVQGLESAVVVGPEAEEIHTDEFGRIRVQFHWDREGQRDERSSCWIPVSQPWGGSGFGAINLPRVGQEVLVEFLAGDPDRPVVIGRVFTAMQPPPYKLPDFKTVSGIRSETSPRIIGGGSGDGSVVPSGGMLGGNPSMLSPDAIAGTLQSQFFNAQSPNSQTHQWRGNELSFFDQPGRQQLYLQAERDFRILAKNTWTSVVGNVRSAHVGTDDVLRVDHKQLEVIGNNQTISVGADRWVGVIGKQEHEITGDISITGYKNQTHTITETNKSTAKIQHVIGNEMLVLEVGKSKIVMRPDFIIVQATDVFINPGEGDTQKAIEEGKRPEKPEERAAREAAERAAAARAEGIRRAQDAINNPTTTNAGNAVRQARRALTDGGITDVATQDQIIGDALRSKWPAESHGNIQPLLNQTHLPGQP